jgi:hypothetical protein
MGYPGWMAATVNAGRAAVLWVQSERYAAIYDGPAPDTRAPRCDVQDFEREPRGVFSFNTECDEAADISATVTMRARRRRELGERTGHVRANRPRTLRLRVESDDRRALARVAARRRVTVRLRLTVTDDAGNSRVVRRRMAILADE